MGRAVFVLTAALVCVAGCPAPRGAAPVDRREALERVNANLGRIREPVHCTGWVTFRFRDDQGRMRSFDLNEARLLYRPPQSLLLDVRSSLAGTVAQFGSNDDEYWLWIDVPDFRKLWRGSWQRIGARGERALPILPNELFDALMLRPLPESLEGGQLPLLRVDGEDHRLIFVRLSPGGQPLGWREVRLQPQPPYQPVEIIDRMSDGEVVMHAQLSGYAGIGREGPLTARRYVVHWPRHDAEMRLDLLGAKSRPDLPEDVFDSPAGWQGEWEDIDAAPQGSAVP